MKFIKKAAALFFCLALALSVMAISALAAFTDPNFTLTLTSTDTTTRQDLNNNSINEYKAGETVTYNLTLGDGQSETNYEVNALEFKLTVGTTPAVLTPVVTINGMVLTATADANNTAGVYIYKYVASDNSTPTLTDNDSNSKTTLPTDGQTVIGSIAFTTVAPTSGQSAKATFIVENAAAHYGDNVGTTEAPLYDPNGYAVDVTNGNGSFEVHRNYTIYLKTYTFDPTTKLISGSASDSTPATMTYNVVDGVTVAKLDDAKGNGNVVTYEFKGWTIASVGDVTHNWGSSDIATEGTNYTVSGKYGDVTLTAIFTPKSYNATFVYANDKNNTANAVLSYTIASAFTEPAAPTRDGYTFAGWQVTNGEGRWGAAETPKYGSVATAFLTNAYGAVTFTAAWTPVKYYATLASDDSTSFTTSFNNTDAQSGDSDPTDVQVEYDADGTLTVSDPSKTGYTFKGWKITTAAGSWTAWSDDENKEDTRVIYGDSSKIDGAQAFPANQWGNITLTAQWEINGYFKQVNYKFAFSDNSANVDKLTLFAVKTADGSTGEYANPSYIGIYKYDGAKMLIVNKYVALFSEIAESERTSWTVFATVAPTSGADKVKVTYKELGDSESKNAQIDYDGNVNGQDGADIGDYGTADSIFTAPGTYSKTAIDADSRLKMDMSQNASAEGDNAEFASFTDGTYVGNIWDLRALMGAANLLTPSGNGGGV